MKRFCYLTTLATALAMPTVHAETGDDWLKVEGFGTLGIFHADDPNATVRNDIRTSTGARNETRFDADSVFALQLKYKPPGPINAGLQLISKKNVESTHKPRVQWAYIGWEPTPEFNVKLGRSVAPVLLMSDYNDLYYAQTAARPPSPVYSNNSITFNDGVTAQWERNLGGSGVINVEGYYGKTKIDVSVGSIDVPKQMGLSLKWTKGPLTLRAGYTRSEAEMTPFAGTSLEQILGVMRGAQSLGICSNCNEIYANRFKLKDVVNKIPNVGFIWDDGDNIFQGEWVERTTDSIILSGSGGWYLMGGRRFGTVTPYALYGSIKPIADPVGMNLVTPANPNATQRALLAALQGASASNITGLYKRRQTGLGVRWDLASNVALKFQWDQYKIKNTTWGSSNAVSFTTGPNSRFDGKVNAYALNFDFIF